MARQRRRGVLLLSLTAALTVGGIGVATAAPRIIAAVHPAARATATTTTTAVSAATATTTAVSAASIASSVAAAAAPAAKKAPSVPAGASVGPLFPDGLSGSHNCTASVVDSPAGDVIVTAAHCVSGTAAGEVFAPGYAGGSAPYGTWVVTGAYADAGWLSGQSAGADYAFLTVKPSSGGTPVQDAVGGNALGTAPTSGAKVTVTGYASGTGGTPVVCTAAVTYTGSSPTFGCEGYVGGTSGGPWVDGTTVAGVIGGLHQGGCEEQVSYTSAFTTATAAVFARAADGAHSDTLPTPGGDGC